MNTKELKNKILILHTTFGVPYNFIAKNCNISGTHLNLWLNDKKGMSEKSVYNV